MKQGRFGQSILYLNGLAVILILQACASVQIPYVSPRVDNGTQDKSTPIALGNLVTAQGTKKGQEIVLQVKAADKRCLRQFYLEDTNQNVVVPYKITYPSQAPFGIGIGFGIGGRKGTRAESLKKDYSQDPKGTYIPREQRQVRTGGGSTGFALGLAIPVFDLFKGEECEREVEAKFVLPQAQEKIESWKLRISVSNPETKEEVSTLLPLFETEGKVRILVKAESTGKAQEEAASGDERKKRTQDRIDQHWAAVHLTGPIAKLQQTLPRLSPDIFNALKAATIEALEKSPEFMKYRGHVLSNLRKTQDMNELEDELTRWFTLEDWWQIYQFLRRLMDPNHWQEVKQRLSEERLGRSHPAPPTPEPGKNEFGEDDLDKVRWLEDWAYKLRKEADFYRKEAMQARKEGDGYTADKLEEKAQGRDREAEEAEREARALRNGQSQR